MGYEREPVMILRTLTRLSLALNAVVACLVMWAVSVRHNSDAPSSIAQQLTHRAVRVRRVVEESAPSVVALNAPFHWCSVESSDYRVYMANLRAIGCPERIVRDIIVADVDQLFITRLREQFYPLHRQVWWILANQDQVEALGKRMEKDWDALTDERRAVLTALIGKEKPYAADDDEDSAARERTEWTRTLDFLPAEKRERVLALRKATQSAINQLWAGSGGITKAERQQRQQQQREWEADRDRQLAESLTPDELEEYRLRMSPIAGQLLRGSCVEFSEDELRAIVQVNTAQQEGTRQIPNTPEGTQQRERAAQQAEEELKAMLGEARFADYQRASDSRFEQLSRVVERYGMAEEQALAVYDILQQADAQARQLREDPTRSVEERTALLHIVHDETEQALLAGLGARALATYRAQGGEHWLQNLAAPPK